MKRLFLALTLLLMAFLSTLDPLARLHGATSAMERLIIELLLAVAAVTAFAHFSELHRRLLFPRRGLRLLLAGIVTYAMGAAVATGALANGIAMIPLEKDSAWARLPEYVELLRPLPLLVVGQVLLLVGAFRALTNLVPPDEFAEDF